MNKPRTIRYIITNDKGLFLIDLWNGKPQWSVIASDPVNAGNAWLDLTTARARCKHCAEALGEPLHLSLLEFVSVEGRWQVASQQGVAG